MNKTVSTRGPRKDPFVKWMFLGIVVSFLAAAGLHFVYDWTGNNVVAGLFAPVNESTWEHLKLVYWPVLLWWSIGYLLLLRKKSRGFARAAVTCAVSALFGIVFVVAYYYTHTGALGVESLAADIIGLFIGLLFGILLARHVDRHSKPRKLALFLAVAVVLLMAGAFIYFTFAPPQLPIFKDPSGTYGI